MSTRRTQRLRKAEGNFVVNLNSRSGGGNSNVQDKGPDEKGCVSVTEMGEFTWRSAIV